MWDLFEVPTLLIRKKYTSYIPVSDNSQEPTGFENVQEYETQEFAKRLQQAVTIDRIVTNSFSKTMNSLWEIKTSNNPKQFSDLLKTLSYRTNRELNGWHTKRQMNKEMVDSKLAHSQIMELAAPVVLELLMERKPTEKDLKNLFKADSQDSKKNERTVRRNFKRYSYMMGNHPIVNIHIKNQDGSIDKYPKIPDRKDPADDDKRLTSIMTNYSLGQGRVIFDPKDYVDCNYFIRLKKFWKSVLGLLAQVYEKYGPIRKEMNWLTYHIVNNDVGLHVLFDNLSLECEDRWFQRLGEDKRRQIVGIPGLESDPYMFTKTDAYIGVLELQRFAGEFQRTPIPSMFDSYIVSPRTMRRRMHECALESADAYHKSGNYPQSELIMNAIDRLF